MKEKKSAPTMVEGSQKEVLEVCVCVLRATERRPTDPQLGWEGSRANATRTIAASRQNNCPGKCLPPSTSLSEVPLCQRVGRVRGEGGGRRKLGQAYNKQRFPPSLGIPTGKLPDPSRPPQLPPCACHEPAAGNYGADFQKHKKLEPSTARRGHRPAPAFT